jgi:hypothetical protein
MLIVNFTHWQEDFFLFHLRQKNIMEVRLLEGGDVKTKYSVNIIVHSRMCLK